MTDLLKLTVWIAVAILLMLPIGALAQSLDYPICGTEEDPLDPIHSPAPVDGPIVRAMVVLIRFCDDNVKINRGWLWTPTVSCEEENDRVLPDFATGLLVPPGPNDAVPTAAAIQAADSSLTAYFWEQSKGGTEPRLLMYGDVLPADENGPYVYVTQHPNSYYHTTNNKGYGYLTEEVLNYLHGEGVDFNEYDSNDDGYLDQVFMIVRRDYRHRDSTGTEIRWGGIANLYGHWGDVTGGSSGNPGQLSYDGVDVSWTRSGTYHFAAIASNIVHQSYHVWMMAHEYGHHLWTPSFLGSTHVRPIIWNDVPSNEPPGASNRERLYGHTLMQGAPFIYNSASSTISAMERDARDWLDVTELTADASDLTLMDLYTSGEAFRIPLSTGDRRMYLSNHQRFSYFDSLKTNPGRPGDYAFAADGQHATGLLVSIADGYRFNNIPADGDYHSVTHFINQPPNPFHGDLYGPETGPQITPWTRPNINGFINYETGFQPDFFAVDNIRYDGSPDSVIVFDFYQDFRTASTTAIRSDSWMGAETSGSTFSGEVVVKSGVTLTLWQGTDIEFGGGLTMEPGSRLVLEDAIVTLPTQDILGDENVAIEIYGSAQIRIGNPDLRLVSNAMTVIGDPSLPALIAPYGQNDGWEGIRLVGGGEWPHHLEFARIEGAEIGLDIRTTGAMLWDVELVDNGVGISTDYYVPSCTEFPCGVSEPSLVSLGRILVEGGSSHGLYLRNADVYLGESTIRENAGVGVYVQNTQMMSFYENVIENNGNPWTQTQDGLRVGANAELHAGRRGDMVGFPGLNRIAENERQIAYLAGGYLVLGEEFWPGDGVGHHNTIYSTSTGCWVHNSSGTELDAILNFWGDERGPDPAVFCGTDGVSYEPVHDQDETGGSGGGYRPVGTEVMLSAAFGHASSSPRDGGTPLGDRIRQVRSQLANNPESPSASARVRRLTVLHRQDVGDGTGEWAESYALLTQLRQTLLDQDPTQLPPGLRRAAERSATALLRVALAHQEYEGADELLTAYDGLVVGTLEARELALSAINVDEVFGRYDDAIYRIEALITEIGTSDEGLVADLEFLAAVIAAKRDEAGDAGRGAPPATTLAATQAAGSSTMTFNLGPAFPNPTSGGTELPLMLPEGSKVMVAVYDVLGRRVAVLVDGRLDAGQHRMHFASGAVSAGLYVVRAEVMPDSGGSHVFTRRVTVVR